MYQQTTQLSQRMCKILKFKRYIGTATSGPIEIHNR